MRVNDGREATYRAYGYKTSNDDKIRDRLFNLNLKLLRVNIVIICFRQTTAPFHKIYIMLFLLLL